MNQYLCKNNLWSAFVALSDSAKFGEEATDKSYPVEEKVESQVVQKRSVVGS
jgi:hypothetical protein